MSGVQIRWKRGEFYEFRATTKIHLGSIQMDIYEDDLVEFDGQTLRYAGADYSVPTLRAGIKAGWLVPSDDNVSRYVSQPAGVKVRPATPQTRAEEGEMVFETATEEEAVVGTLEGHQQRREDSRKGSNPRRRATREDSTPPQRHARKEAAPPPRPAPKPVRVEDPVPVDYSDDKTISAAEKDIVARADEINRRRIAEAMAQEVPPPAEYDDDDYEDEPQQGKFGVVRVDDQQGVEVGGYRFSSGAAVGAPGDPSLKETTPINKMKRSAGQPVATTPQRDKPLTKTQVPREGNIDISAKLEGGATGDVAEAISGDELTDLLPNAAQGPNPDLTVNWDKSPHWRTRVKIAVEEYGNDPDAIAHIKSVESPGVIKAIDQALEAR